LFELKYFEPVGQSYRILSAILEKQKTPVESVIFDLKAEETYS